MKLGAALLLLVAAVHYGCDPLAAWLYPDSATGAARALFYVARGFEGAILWIVVWVYAPKGLPIAAACAWGCLENAQTSICRLAFDLGKPPPATHYWGGLCDTASGLPVVGITLAVITIVAGIISAQGERK